MNEELNPILSKENDDEKKIQGRLIAKEIFYHGNLPPPAMLADFDKIIPNGAERIMVMAEKEQHDKYELEKVSLEIQKEGINNEHKETVLGQKYAVTLSLSFVLVGVLLVLTGHTEAGIVALGVVGLNRIANALITRNKPQ